MIAPAELNDNWSFSTKKRIEWNNPFRVFRDHLPIQNLLPPRSAAAALFIGSNIEYGEDVDWIHVDMLAPSHCEGIQLEEIANELLLHKLKWNEFHITFNNTWNIAFMILVTQHV